MASRQKKPAAGDTSRRVFSLSVGAGASSPKRRRTISSPEGAPCFTQVQQNAKIAGASSRRSLEKPGKSKVIADNPRNGEGYLP
jgi:hypothetical protein